jgi:hypothetical protein
MRRLQFLFFFIAGVFILSSPMGPIAFGEEIKITKPEIVQDTPKRKTKGKKTVVIFKHKDHAEERAKGDCKICHETIKQELEAPANNKKLVHKACKACHKKGKSAEKLTKCKSCHTTK